MIGTKLAHYEIAGHLGSGGMGDVYQATDTKLGRSVAIKFLPEAFSHDAERVARFQREARVLASLNHPNIAAIHGFEEIDARHFLVMELVAGETLADRVKRGTIPIEEALPIAKQIAEALEEAHEKGIIHRDLKPANIKITPAGRVKVLDFGLAKIYEPETSEANLSNSPTLMSARTTGGVILGTVSYMSPEQARGRTVTKQTDIWAFGCVLFEMLTGSVAFSGETTSDTIAKILKEDPDWLAAKSIVPPTLLRTIQRCLEKDVRRRFRDAGDVGLELEEAPSLPLAPVMPQSKSSLFLLAFLMLVVIGLAGSVLWLRTGGNKPELTWTGTLMGGPAIAYGPRVSPDGKMLAFQALVDGTSQVAVMNVKSGNWTLLTHDKNSGFVGYATWSRDGTRIYFSRDNRTIYSIPALGGEQRLLLENADYPDELPDRSLVVVRRNRERVQQLHRFRPDTGEIRPLNALIASVGLGVPAASFRVFPDGGQVVFFGRPAEAGAQVGSRLYILDLNSNRTRLIGQGSYDFSAIFGLAVNPAAKSVLVNVRNSDLHQILSVPTEAGRPLQTVLTLTDPSGYIDLATDGSLYVDQVVRPMQALRFTESAQPAETMAVVPIDTNPSTSSVLELSDGRLLLTALFDGRSRLVVAKSSGEFSPFIDTDEETFGPATSIGSDRVAFIFGKPPEQSIAIASIKDGRLIERRKIMAIDTFHSLSSSPDGATLFYTDSGSIWSIPIASGEARKLGPGDAVAFDPHQGNLIVSLNENGGVRLVRMPVLGGATETIPIHAGDIRIASPSFLGPNAVRQDGRIVLSAAFRDSWFFGPAILDPASGELRKVPLRYDADFFSFSWNQKNQIVAAAFLLRSSIWRFRPQSSN